MIEFFKKEYNIILIESSGGYYFKIRKKKVKFEVLKTDVLKISLYSQNVFNLRNLEIFLKTFIEKYRLKELSIVLHLPNILFQKLTVPRGIDQEQSVLNYLRATFPLPLEKYSFFYKEIKYGFQTNLSNLNIVFLDKEITENLLRIMEKYNLLPFFIVPSLEVIYQYLLNKSLIDFNEEYLIFFIDKNILITFFIKNLIIEKNLSEEIDIDKTDLNLIIARFYNFLKPNLKKEAKIMFISEKELSNFTEISHPQIFLPFKPLEILIEGSYLIFEKTLQDQKLIDFLPFKPYSAYFLNRLPSITIFLSVYFLFLSLIFSGAYFIFNSKLKKEIAKLSEEVKINRIKKSESEEQINQLVSLTKILKPEILENFFKLEEIVKMENLEKINFNREKPLSFSLKVNQNDLEKTKFQISQTYPSLKLIQEETISENEVRLVYSF